MNCLKGGGAFLSAPPFCHCAQRWGMYQASKQHIKIEHGCLWLQTLMATRSPVLQERLRAIAAVDGLIGRMREEYLLLLPEALPFLAELLEDPEHQVASATQQLVKKLEDLSGESLEQYLKV